MLKALPGARPTAARCSLLEGSPLMPPVPPDESTAPPAPPERPNVLFRALIPAGAIFVITIFALVAVTFGDPKAPPAQFFDRYGLVLILVEVAAILVLIVSAMTVDRWQTLRGQKRDSDEL